MLPSKDAVLSPLTASVASYLPEPPQHCWCSPEVPSNMRSPPTVTAHLIQLMIQLMILVVITTVAADGDGGVECGLTVESGG